MRELGGHDHLVADRLHPAHPVSFVRAFSLSGVKERPPGVIAPAVALIPWLVSTGGSAAQGRRRWTVEW